ncbi:hypothetical protein SARC_00697 [Sphaeroforma arctica JP610]|uniref:Uncharacterized protein n=1 Tax=Sphaeroforma arctica JP610 TaxID=667725 RepID=A0A0L0GE51_9EUKA|nr:hypothetical protein SARC_00697 [Sphaeroforma arctica JP610]KNC87169.1 hypothetical protein SARC_00697 [Sphaeroforma arctica JP610]|eukprot:XP_014161071.1 hypothetical protein SARC_00697 [Sphaeroforma arctica JP610]
MLGIPPRPDHISIVPQTGDESMISDDIIANPPLPSDCDEQRFRKYMNESAFTLHSEKGNKGINGSTVGEGDKLVDKVVVPDAGEVYQKLSFDFPQYKEHDGRALLNSDIWRSSGLPQGCTFNRTLVSNVTEAAIKESNGSSGFESFGEVYHRVVLKGLLHLLTCDRTEAALLLRSYKIQVETTERTLVVEVPENGQTEHTYGEEDGSDFEFEDFDSPAESSPALVDPTRSLTIATTHIHKLMDLYSFVTPITLACISHQAWVEEHVTDTLVAIIACLSEMHVSAGDTQARTSIHGAENGATKGLSVAQGVGMLTAVMSTRPVLVEDILPHLIPDEEVGDTTEADRRDYGKVAKGIVRKHRLPCEPHYLSILECVPLADDTEGKGAAQRISQKLAQGARETCVTYDGWRAYARAVAVCLPTLAEVAADAISVVLLHQKELKKQARLAEKAGTGNSGRGTVFDSKGLTGLRHEVASVTAIVSRYVRHGPRESVASELLGCGLWRDLVRLIVLVGVTRKNEAEDEFCDKCQKKTGVGGNSEVASVGCCKDPTHMESKQKSHSENVNMEIVELLKMVTQGCCGYEELSAYTLRVGGFKAVVLSLGNAAETDKQPKIDTIILPDLYVVWLCMYTEAYAPEIITSYLTGASVPELHSLSVEHMHTYCEQASDTASRLKVLLSLLAMLKAWGASHKLVQAGPHSKNRNANQGQKEKSQKLWGQLLPVMLSTYSVAEKLVKQNKNSQQFRAQWSLPAPSSKVEDASHGVVQNDTDGIRIGPEKTSHTAEVGMVQTEQPAGPDTHVAHGNTRNDSDRSTMTEDAQVDAEAVDACVMRSESDSDLSEAERELREKVAALHALCCKGLWQLHLTLKTDFLSHNDAGCGKAD